MTQPPDLTTRYLGLQLHGPIIAAACPLTGKIESLLRLQEGGAAAAVLPSLFEEQIEHDELEFARLIDLWALSSPESSGYFPELDRYNFGPGDYLDLVAEAKRSLEIPIIASLNGATPGGWLRYAGLLERAGVDAIELNIYHISMDPQTTAVAVEQDYLQLVRMLRQGIQIPIAVKLGPYFSALPHFALQLERAGAAGLVLFNRYLSPDIDLETLRFTSALELSTPAELRLALRWIAILRDQLGVSLAATGGVHSGQEVVKSLLAGADVVACASALLEHAPEVIGEMQRGLVEWMSERGYESVAQLRGSMSAAKCSNPDGLQRANYMKALTSFTPRPLGASER